MIETASPLYMHCSINGVEHGISQWVGYETFCGLPLVQGAFIPKISNSMSFVNKEDFCEMCYDEIALSTLANI